MSNLVHLDFAPLEPTGENYISWVLDVELHLEAKNLGHTIKGDAVEIPINERAGAITYLRRHLSQSHIDEYVNYKDPLSLWNILKERYGHLKVVTLPKARNEWIHLRFQDFKSVSAYNSALYKIVAKLELCGEPVSEESKLEKTFSTFHSSQIVLQQQYRERRFTRYSESICCILLAEQNNELLVKNHESRPCGSALVPEVNKISYSGDGRGNGKHGYHGKKTKRGGRKHKNGRNHPYIYTDAKKAKGKESPHDAPKKTDNRQGCYRCGCKNHWVKICRTPPHLCELYMKASKENEARNEMNLAEARVSTESPTLGLSSYLTDFDGFNGVEHGTEYDQFTNISMN